MGRRQRSLGGHPWQRGEREREMSPHGFPRERGDKRRLGLARGDREVCRRARGRVGCRASHWFGPG